MTKTKKEKIFSSVLSVDERYIAALPYLMWLIYHLTASLLFFAGVMTAGKIDLEKLILLYLNNYWSYIDIVLAVIPLVFLLIEKRSKLVIYYCSQYLIIDLCLPWILLMICMLIMTYAGTVGVLTAIIISGVSQLVLMTLNLISIYMGSKQMRAGFGFLSVLPKKLALHKGGKNA